MYEKLTLQSKVNFSYIYKSSKIMGKFSIFYVCWLSFVITMSCQHPFEQGQPKADGNASALVAEARAYYDSQLAQRSRARGEKPYDAFLPAALRDKKVQWDNALTFKSDGKDVVEAPITYGTVDPAYKFTIDDSRIQKSLSTQNGTTRALFFKQKNGKINAYIMKLIASGDYVKTNKKYKDLSFNTVTKNFTGVMLLSKWDEQLLSIYYFENGKIVSGTGRKITKNSKGRGCIQVQRCRPYCIYWSSPCCTPEEDARNPTGVCCAAEYALGKVCGTTCYTDWICFPDPEPSEPEPENPSDNEPTDPRNDQCANASAELEQAMARTSAASELVSSTLEDYESSSVSSTVESYGSTRVKQYRWKCVTNPVFHLISLDTGTHRKVGAGEESWEWVGLNHNGLSLEGVWAGGTLTYADKNNLATVGKYHASMALDVELTFSTGCEGGVGITRYKSLHTSKMFTISD